MDHNSLPPGLIESLISELADQETAGIVLAGSYARGEETPFSDIDIAPFLHEGAPPRRKRLFYRDGYLVSVSYKSIAGVRTDLSLPNRAIWVVNGYRGAQVLLDRDGSIRALMREIEAFTWEPLQPAANEYAGASLAGSAEAVHKLLGDLSMGNDLAIALMTINLLWNLTDLVAVQRGVLVKSDRTYYRQVQESVGLESEWTRYHNLAAGVAPLPAEAQGTTARSRGIAVLALYRETLALVERFIAPVHRETATQAVRILDAALPPADQKLLQ
ncbi:MAG: nucleotidyltransferase domain-containing protein [Chloroflexota bacterium]|nr:nucleotidyltransferase domain-containing protein [Chloroflexota bacterium]MDQ5866695.1 nucleotidyltransferase domain-containing protein [Chloroflexota bacterium]